MASSSECDLAHLLTPAMQENCERTVIPSETFSPDSGSSQNTNRSMIDRKMIGIKTFMMVY